MGQPSESLYFGPYRLVRPLAPSALAERWLALHEKKQSSHVVHRFPVCRAKPEQRRVLAALEQGQTLHAPHVLPIELFSLSITQQPCAVTPYTGNHEGILTLSNLLEAKGGRMAGPEAERAMCHLLEASSAAHRAGQLHGDLAWEEVLVDRHGSCSVEFYGLRRRLGLVAGPVSELRRDEVRSIIEMGYRLITGLSPDEPRISPTRLSKRLDSAWDAFFDMGLNAAGGFDTAQDAISALPSSSRDRVRQQQPSTVRVVLSRFGWAGSHRQG